MKLTNRKRLNSVLGLTLDGGRLEAVLLRRSNGSAEVKKSTNVPLTLDLLRNEVELVGREIRNLLDAAGIRERRCAVGVPPEWVLSLHTALPDLPEEDIQSFLEMEAERGFPHALDQLQTTSSRVQTGSNGYATQLAVVSDQVRQLEAVLSAAQLRPVRMSLAIAALPGAISGSGQGNLTAVVNDSNIALLVSVGGGIVALRTLDNVFEAEGSERRVLADAVARELRITLAQLPADLRDNLRELRVMGAGTLADTLARELESRVHPLNLAVRRLTTSNGTEHGLKIAGATQLSGALSLAAQFLSDHPAAPNFLPPKPTFWQQLSARYSGKRLAYSAGIGGAVAALICGMFLFQGYQLSSLERQWKAMEKKVDDLKQVQGQIRTFRPWYDQNLASLTILREVTEAFPEEGSVNAKTVEIRNQSTVNVSGTTRDNSALLKTLDRLRAAPDVSAVKVDTIRGKTPMQFTFNFQWGTP